MTQYINIETIRCPRLLTTVYDTDKSAATLWLDLTYIKPYPQSMRIGGYPTSNQSPAEELASKRYIVANVLAQLIVGLG